MLNKSTFYGEPAQLCDAGSSNIKDLAPFGSLTKFPVLFNQRFPGKSPGAFESTILGIAGTSPAFIMSVTTASIVTWVGMLSVGSPLYFRLVRVGIMLNFIHLSTITHP